MKTYKEMAHDVLKRRDEELQKLVLTQNETYDYTPDKAYPARSNKRRLLPRILIPCAAAVTAATIGIVVFNNFPKNNVDRLTNNIGKQKPETNNAANILNSKDNIGDVYDIAPPASADKYKGGETEINYNEITEEDFCVYNLPVLVHDDFVTIPDDEINKFYGIKFDRLDEVLGEGEHKPFGYYNRDIESGEVVEHSVHGYYNVNLIQYSNECAEITVSASYNKYDTAAVENAKPSVINGFEAVVFVCGKEDDQNITLAADINMEGLYVTIMADCSSTNCLVDCRSYMEHCKNLFEETLKSYTAPVDDNTEDGERINMLDKYPDFLCNSDNPFAQLCWSEVIGLKIEKIDIYKANEFYGIELDILGKLHKDWEEEGKDALEIYYSKPKDELIELGRPNKLSYCKPNGARLEVSVSTRKVSIPNNESYINGQTAVLYCADGFDRVKTDDEYPNGDHEYYGIINFGKCSAELYSRGFTEEEFLNVLREFTEKKIE